MIVPSFTLVERPVNFFLRATRNSLEISTPCITEPYACMPRHNEGHDDASVCEIHWISHVKITNFQWNLSLLKAIKFITTVILRFQI